MTHLLSSSDDHCVDYFAGLCKADLHPEEDSEWVRCERTKRKVLLEDINQPSTDHRQNR